MLGLFDKLAINDYPFYDSEMLLPQQEDCILSLDNIRDVSFSDTAVSTSREGDKELDIGSEDEQQQEEERGEGEGEGGEEKGDKDIFGVDIEYVAANRRMRFRSARRSVSSSGSAVVEQAKPEISLPLKSEVLVENVHDSERSHFQCIDELWDELKSASSVHCHDCRGNRLTPRLLHPLPRAKLGLQGGGKVGETLAKLPTGTHLPCLGVGAFGRIELLSYLGVGAFGHVLLGRWKCASENDYVAVKIDSGVAHTLWECVIHTRIYTRLRREAGDSLKTLVRQWEQYSLFPEHVFHFDNASALVMPRADLGSLFGVLLALHGSSAVTAHDRELCIAYLSKQMLAAIDFIHSHGILHTDIKCDNWCLRSRFDTQTLCISLIDFGKAKDLANTHGDCTSFQRCGRLFHGTSAAPYMASPQMRNGDPWCFHADYYALLACIHNLLFADELLTAWECASASHRRGFVTAAKGSFGWIARTTIPRYMCRSLWSRMYLTLLNSNERPSEQLNLNIIHSEIDVFLSSNTSALSSVLEKLISALKNRQGR